MIKIRIDEIDFETFQKNYKDADAYYKRAEQFLQEGQYPSVVFNVASIALERYLIAFGNRYGIEARNHNYGSLMDSVELVTDFPEELNKEIRNFDVLYNICSVDNPFSRIPDLFDVDQILSICDKIKYMIDEIDSPTKN
ncbi:hypothetical protein CDLVIII_4246 [Clostridium sp. DL-VIII]|uniref:HEPN domain-containing protein n=1 Tax=Clostridium sp. DL-VIII TaxID=641107 RepID=UPI00023B04B1|nr:HEPN domain-containing protein [Clostridium sp. DL-VIII]EHJ00769.1 hypothetical protein CDLVIII_4246 [Clostridium sp. DL-VIII]